MDFPAIEMHYTISEDVIHINQHELTEMISHLIYDYHRYKWTEVNTPEFIHLWLTYNVFNRPEPLPY